MCVCVCVCVCVRVWKRRNYTESNIIVFYYLFLGDYLQEFVLLCQRKESTGQLLGRTIGEPVDDTGKCTGHHKDDLTDNQS